MFWLRIRKYIFNYTLLSGGPGGLTVDLSHLYIGLMFNVNFLQVAHMKYQALIIMKQSNTIYHLLQ